MIFRYFILFDIQTISNPAMVDSIFSTECMCLVNVLAAMVWMHHSTLTLLDVHLLDVSCQPLQTGEGSYGLPHPRTSSPLTLELQFWNVCKPEPDELCEMWNLSDVQVRPSRFTPSSTAKPKCVHFNFTIEISIMGCFIILLIPNLFYINTSFCKIIYRFSIFIRNAPWADCEALN